MQGSSAALIELAERLFLAVEIEALGASFGSPSDFRLQSQLARQRPAITVGALLDAGASSPMDSCASRIIFATSRFSVAQVRPCIATIGGLGDVEAGRWKSDRSKCTELRVLAASRRTLEQ